MAFDIFGTLLEIAQVEMAQLWNTRWVSHDPDTPSLWDAVDDDNQLQPTGRALAIWSRFLNEQMVHIEDGRRIRTFASYSPCSGRLSLFLTNKDADPQQLTVALKGYGRPTSAQRWLWRGEGPQDFHPTWSGPDTAALTNHEIALDLPADSLTVVELRGSAG